MVEDRGKYRQKKERLGGFVERARVPSKGGGTMEILSSMKRTGKTSGKKK